MSEKQTGACLCGDVQISISAQLTNIGVCHCEMCRKWCGGGPLLAFHSGPELDVHGHEYITNYDSSEWAERGFCSKCGTHLFYHLKNGGDFIVAAGLFEDASAFKVAEEIFIDKKPGHYACLSEQSKKKTAAQVFAEVTS